MNIVFFETEAAHSKYGNGAYAANILPHIPQQADLTWFHIHLFSFKYPEITIQKEENITHIHIPFKIPKIGHCEVSRMSASALYCILSEEIDLSIPTVFHLNSNLQCSIAEILTENDHNNIIYTVHVALWREIFDNNRNLYETIVKYNPKHNVLYSIQLENIICNRASKVICLTDEIRDLVISKYNKESSNVCIIHNGFYIRSNTDKCINTAAIKKELGLPVNEKVILFAGRLHPTKGVTYLINAFRMIVEKDKDAPLRLVISGNEHTAFLGGFDQYLKLCAGMRGKVSFTGYLDKKELYKFYQIADVGVIPSLHEQNSYVALEMMAHGLPMVVCDIPGFENMLEHNVSALKSRMQQTATAEPDTQDMAHKIQCLLDNPSLAQRLSSNARLAVEKKHNSHTMIHQLINLYRSCITTSSKVFG